MAHSKRLIWTRIRHVCSTLDWDNFRIMDEGEGANSCLVAHLLLYANCMLLVAIKNN